MIRGWTWAAICLAAAAWGFSGCATTPIVPAAEAVGTLSASYHSIAVAPLHHDAPPEFAAVVGSDSDDVTSTVTTVTRANAPESPESSELPEVAPKTDGVTVGGAR